MIIPLANLTLLMSCVWNPIYPFQTSSNAQMKGQMCIEYPLDMWPWNEKVHILQNQSGVHLSSERPPWMKDKVWSYYGLRGLRPLDPSSRWAQISFGAYGLLY